MRIKSTLAAAIAAIIFQVHPPPLTALAVPEYYQPVIAAVGWQAKDVPALMNIIWCESKGDSMAVGAAGEVGLTQVHPATWRYYQTLDESVPDLDEHAWNPAAQLYTSRVIHDREGFDPWSCEE